MSSRREKSKKKKKISLILIVASFVVFIIGFYILEKVATRFEVPLGSTFHIVLGCTLMAISGIYCIYAIKKNYFTTKSKSVKHIYLKDSSRKRKNN